jgi:hypothetical protein
MSLFYQSERKVNSILRVFLAFNLMNFEGRISEFMPTPLINI